MTDILIDPSNRRCRLVVVSDVAHELACEVLNRSEDTARNYVTMDLGKPDLDLVKPAGIGRSVMNSDGGVLRKKMPCTIAIAASFRIIKIQRSHSRGP